MAGTGRPCDLTPDHGPRPLHEGRCTTTFGLTTHFAELMASAGLDSFDTASLTRVGAGGGRGVWTQMRERFPPRTSTRPGIPTTETEDTLAGFGTSRVVVRLGPDEWPVPPNNKIDELALRRRAANLHAPGPA